MKNKSKIIGVIIFIILILTIIGIKYFNELKSTDTGEEKAEKSIFSSNLTTVYVATGGGKESFIADTDVQNIMKKKYKLNVFYDSWSNGKLIKNELVREDNVTKYDAMFTSDQRFYDYYKLQPKKEENEADRYQVLQGGLTLNTPIVIYSWKEVCDALINEEIVTENNGVYYITNMQKLMDYILAGKKWSEIGLNLLYGNINIASTDPVTSSPGATYYGLLLSIMCENQVTDESVTKNLPNLKNFYIKSGYMNNTPADLFERYLKTGMRRRANDCRL